MILHFKKRQNKIEKLKVSKKMPAAIISDYNDHPPIKDVIYVVEDSVNLSAFFDDLLSTYLVQALEHFNGGPHTSVERAWASIGCSTTFTLVLVKSTDWRPDLITTFRGPFTSAKRFFNALENISFVGKILYYRIVKLPHFHELNRFFDLFDLLNFIS